MTARDRGIRCRPRESGDLYAVSSRCDTAYENFRATVALGPVIRADAPFKTIEDAQKPGRPLLLGGLAAGGTDTDIVLIARDVFKLNTQLVRGYSSAELNLAIQRGEVEGRAIGMSSIQTGLGD